MLIHCTVDPYYMFPSLAAVQVLKSGEVVTMMKVTPQSVHQSTQVSSAN